MWRSVRMPGLIMLLCLMSCLAAVAQPTSGTTRLASQQKKTLHQYQGTDGSITFTNRPEKYTHRDDFVEIAIKYERIPLPASYKPTPVTELKIVTDENLKSIVTRYASLYQLDEALVYAVIRAESNFNPNAVSPAGARGLMQLMPGTAAEMGVTDIFDPTQNVAGGTQYLYKMMELFQDKKLALAAYNAGPENVKRHKGVPPFQETKSYVKTVLAFEEAYSNGSTTPNLTILGSSKSALGIRQQNAPKTGTYTIHFHSGLTQPADAVHDRDPYWYIVYSNRTYPVRKDLVKAVEKAA
ncbi:MAG: lytic transglycosylase domain-containing protein [Candidatus Hydrogenedentales bacterium]